jgi:hypothetical protein
VEWNPLLGDTLNSKRTHGTSNTYSNHFIRKDLLPVETSFRQPSEASHQNA